jgi:ATP-dependent Clp protease ATP-binding subunit ClpX
MADDLYCKFCGKPENEVEVLVAGPEISVCDECLGLLVEIVAKDHAKWRNRQIEILTKLNDK